MRIDDAFPISSAMVIEKPPPKWLWSWLQIEFYKDELKCEKHVHKYKTVFCTECLEEPVCELCWKESIEEHKGHPYLQVLIASRRASVATKEIKKYLDVAHIQQYKINGKDIIYLSTNVGGAVTKKIVGGAGEPKINPECDICKKKLIESKYIFCSIECKVK
ncbi:hypothetical protein BUALT_Bualt16G0030000 [Buddleja alternifolia]|uniref:B box-type domain-containing protein n=1 Tax=Buddleja alternifolia TaxID=168488 RepID=A0AAV6WJ85_9LAMI|nr:hypothetical protein BUALT_Bualt16G0030000 [Buddleja alternifolia]